MSNYKVTIEKTQSILLALHEGSLKTTLTMLKSGHINTVKVNAMIALLESGCQAVKQMDMLLNTAERLGDAQMKTVKNLRGLLERRNSVAVSTLSATTSTSPSVRVSQTGTTTSTATKSSLLDFADDIAALIASMDIVRFIHYIEI